MTDESKDRFQGIDRAIANIRKGINDLTSPTTEVVGFCGHRPHPRRWEFRTRSSVVRCHRQRRERAPHGSVLGGASTAPVPDSGLFRPCPELGNKWFVLLDNQAYALHPTSELVGFRAASTVIDESQEAGRKVRGELKEGVDDLDDRLDRLRKRTTEELDEAGDEIQELSAETREELNESLDELDEQFEKLRDRTNEELDEAGDEMQELSTEAREELADALDKVDSELDELRDRLTD